MSALVWRTLGIGRTSDVAAIRSAYATALKAMDVDADPARFQALRNARDQALAIARTGAAEAAPDQGEQQVVAAPSPIGDDIVIPIDDSVKASLTVRTIPNPDRAPSSGGLSLTPVRPDPESHRPPPQPRPDAPNQRSLPDEAPGVYTFTNPIVPSKHQDTTLRGGALDSSMSYQDHRRAVLGLLFVPEGEQRRPLGPGDEARLAQHAEALLNDPRMEEIAFRAEAERWFSQIVAASIPRSDWIVDMVTKHFGWLADRGRIDQPATVAAVVARHDSLEFLAKIQQRSHKFNRTWRELTRPASETSSRGFGISRQKVLALLVKIRRDHPDLEHYFDWYRVSLWEDPIAFSSSRGALRYWWLWLIGGGYAALLIIGSMSPEDRSHAPSRTYAPGFSSTAPAPGGEQADPLITADSDLAEVFRSVAGNDLNTDMVRAKNPRLYAMLETNWRLARDSNRDRNVFLSLTGKQLMDRYRAGVRRAPYAIAAAHRRLEVDKAKALSLRRGAAACDDFFKGGVSDDALPTDIEARERALIARTLLETDGDPPRRPGSGMFTVKGPVIEQAARRAGMQPKELVAALNVGGTPKTRCAARIALIETALALPRGEGLALLHSM